MLTPSIADELPPLFLELLSTSTLELKRRMLTSLCLSIREAERQPGSTSPSPAKDTGPKEVALPPSLSVVEKVEPPPSLPVSEKVELPPSPPVSEMVEPLPSLPATEVVDTDTEEVDVPIAEFVEHVDAANLGISDELYSEICNELISLRLIWSKMSSTTVAMLMMF